MRFIYINRIPVKCRIQRSEVGGFKSEMIIKIHCSKEYMFFKNLNVCFKPKTFSSEMKKIPVKLNIFQ